MKNMYPKFSNKVIENLNSQNSPIDWKDFLTQLVDGLACFEPLTIRCEDDENK